MVFANIKKPTAVLILKSDSLEEEFDSYLDITYWAYEQEEIKELAYEEWIQLSFSEREDLSLFDYMYKDLRRLLDDAGYTIKKVFLTNTMSA